MRPRDLPQLLKEAASEWIEDGAMRLSSSLAYYAIFSLAPLLVIVIWIAGLVFGSVQDAEPSRYIKKKKKKKKKVILLDRYPKMHEHDREHGDACRGRTHDE